MLVGDQTTKVLKTFVVIKVLLMLILDNNFNDLSFFSMRL